MKVGYLLNTYPMITTTFIRREMQALEAQDVEVVRYGIRPWDGDLVDEADRSERARVRYLLKGRTSALIGDFLKECVANPLGMARAAGTWLRLMRNAGGQVVRHSAYLLEAVSLKRWCADDGIVHLHTHFSTNAAAVALLAKRLGGATYSFTAHGPDEFEDWRASSLAEKIGGARFVAAISDFCRVQLARASGMSAWNKLHVVRCGVRLKDYDVASAPFEGNDVFVCVGRLCLHKAQTLIVEAVSEVARTHPRVKVVLIGDGESRGDVEAEIAKRGMQNHVVLAGWQDNVSDREAMRQARAVLLPSFAEGLPIVLMEALALGRPVITTYIAGIPELVDRECGWIIPAGSVPDIVQAMTAALEATPSQLTEMGKVGRGRVETSYDAFKNAGVLRERLAEACGGQ